MRKSLSAAAMVVGALMLMASAFAATAGATDGGEENCDGEWISAVYEDVLVKDGYTEVVKEAGWQRYSWTGGPHHPETPPVEVPPHKNWQANTKSDPHGVGKAGPYFRSKGNKGNGDWFYLERVPAVTVEHPPVYENRKVKDGYCVPDDTTVPDTTVPDTTVPDTTVPDTTVPDTTVPPTTVPDTTVPPTTEPPVTVPPVTTPPVTTPPVTEPPVTVPPVTEPPVTEPPVTTPPVTEPPAVSPPTIVEQPPVVVLVPPDSVVRAPVKTVAPVAQTSQLAETGSSDSLPVLTIAGIGALLLGVAMSRKSRTI